MCLKITVNKILFQKLVLYYIAINKVDTQWSNQYGPGDHWDLNAGWNCLNINHSKCSNVLVPRIVGKCRVKLLFTLLLNFT